VVYSFPKYQDSSSLRRLFAGGPLPTYSLAEFCRVDRHLSAAQKRSFPAAYSPSGRPSLHLRLISRRRAPLPCDNFLLSLPVLSPPLRELLWFRLFRSLSPMDPSDFPCEVPLFRFLYLSNSQRRWGELDLLLKTV